MDSELNVVEVEVDPKATVVAIYSATEAEIGRRIEQYANVVPDCSTKDGIAFAKEARAAFREPRLLIEDIRTEKKKPYLEIGRLIDSEAKRITGLVAPHEKTWDDAIKADETRKENEKKEKAQAEIRRVEAIRKKIDAMERAPIDALTLTSAQISSVIEKIEASVIDELYAEFEVEAKEKKAVSLAQLRGLLASRIDQEAAKALADAAQKKLDDERAEFLAQKEAGEKALNDQRAELAKQQLEIEKSRRIAEPAVQAKTEEEGPKPVPVKTRGDSCYGSTLPLMIELARRDAVAFRTKYSSIEDLSFVMEEIDSFLAATAPVATREAVEA